MKYEDKKIKYSGKLNNILSIKKEASKKFKINLEDILLSYKDEDDEKIVLINKEDLNLLKILDNNKNDLIIYIEDRNEALKKNINNNYKIFVKHYIDDFNNKKIENLIKSQEFEKELEKIENHLIKKKITLRIISKIKKSIKNHFKIDFLNKKLILNQKKIKKNFENKYCNSKNNDIYVFKDLCNLMKKENLKKNENNMKKFKINDIKMKIKKDYINKSNFFSENNLYKKETKIFVENNNLKNKQRNFSEKINFIGKKIQLQKNIFSDKNFLIKKKKDKNLFDEYSISNLEKISKSSKFTDDESDNTTESSFFYEIEEENFDDFSDQNFFIKKFSKSTGNDFDHKDFNNGLKKKKLKRCSNFDTSFIKSSKKKISFFIKLKNFFTRK